MNAAYADPSHLASELRQIAAALVDLTPEAKAVLENAAVTLSASMAPPQPLLGQEVKCVDADHWPAWMEDHPGLFVTSVRGFLDQHPSDTWKTSISKQGFRIRLSAVRVDHDEAGALPAESAGRIAELTAQIAEADRRAGAAQRELASVSSELTSLKAARSSMKREAGYHENTSFDVVWDQTLAQARAVGADWDRLLALASEEHCYAGASVQHGEAKAQVPEWARLVVDIAAKGRSPG